MNELKEGMLVETALFPEQLKVKLFKQLEDGKFLLEGVLTKSNQFVERIITADDLQKITIIDTTLDFSTKASETLLAIEAIRFRNAYLFDPLLAMNASKVDPLPFQIEAVYGFVLKQLPKIRFMIADDPGAGKTIMAGLILKELKLRGLVKRTLIVVPGHLKDQWQREMKDKFKESFSIVDRNILKSLYGENPWTKENQVITSIDFAKQETIRPLIESTTWDLVIVDEAHKMSAYLYGDKTKKTERYKLGEILSQCTRHLLFLTATPHKGDPENFRLLLDLLLPGMFATSEQINESINNRDNPLFIRRLKEDLRDFEGKPIFTGRFPKTIRFSLSDNEKRLYNELSKYVEFQYKKIDTRPNKKRNVTFAIVILQRRMASSIYALLKSLERRKERLNELLKYSDTLPEEQNLLYTDLETLEEIDDYEENQKTEIENKWETLTTSRNKHELENEIRTIETLINKAKQILDSEEEVKLKQLKEAINQGFEKIRECGGNEKILIFTESRDTLEYLVQKIRSWGYSVNYIHGGMSLEERINAEKVFRNETQILVATEAAGEGINLQFCNIMINYDIPWNPVKLEQRIGRLHRYGQQKDVFFFNLVADDTREGMVLIKMLEKIEEIRRAMGSDRVFDVIGDIFMDINLSQLIIEAITNTRSRDDIIKYVDIRIDNAYIEKLRNMADESLATRYIDFTRIKEMTEKAKEQRLIPEYVEEFFKKAFQKLNGKFNKKNDVISIESIPWEIRKIADEVNHKLRYGSMLRSYPKATFDKDFAFKNPEVEFISFGHPLLEAIIEWIHRNYVPKIQKGAVFQDPSGKYHGVIWFFEGEVCDGKGDIAGKRILALYDDGKELREINPTIILDLIPCDTPQIVSPPLNREKAELLINHAIEKYKQELLQERIKQSEIKRKYGVKSLEHLIQDLDCDIHELMKKENEESIIRLHIENKEKQKKSYEEQKAKLEKEIEQEKQLSYTPPKFLTAIYVQPTPSTESVSNEEIEKIGMQIAMQYEKEHGREPEDVSKENLGYDIRSVSKDNDKEVRYIEVKAKSQEGHIELTPNEWLKAKRFKTQYWLYIVINAHTQPTLYLINNPAETLTPEEKIEVVRFLIPLSEWKNKGVRYEQTTH